ncbi:hypothetical protein GCM10028818_37860 [Spirosoma horti]
MPFDVVYRQELKEVNYSRNDRKQQTVKSDGMDPLQQAKTMHLTGLAFSGGGIRSATFNLGVLQGLAKAGLLPQFDYLSTVSGGGYIGAWYTTWIKRDGLLLKVQDRLNTEKSTDPRGEEVRPIRWLRMFSNYLAPSNNIMSTDSWTVGITWIRNTILNQIIILLLLCSVLLLGLCGYLVWSFEGLSQYIPEQWAFITFSIFLLTGSIIAGIGMASYRPDLFPGSSLGSLKYTYVTAGLVALGLITSYLVSSWLFFYSKSANQPYTFDYRFSYLTDTALVGTLGLLLVALFGRYDSGLPGNNWLQKAVALLLSILFSVLSAFFGILSLDLAWGLLQDLAVASKTSNSWNASFIVNGKDFSWHALFTTREFLNRFTFVIGPPLILEVLSVMVVLRMALLGKYFPDARREWWGRIGAVVHRGMVIWIILASIGLLGEKMLEAATTYLVAITGGWVALVGLAVRLAYSASTPAQGDAPKTLPTKAKDFLVRLAPYVFIIGLLIIAAKLINLVLQSGWLNDPTTEPPLKAVLTLTLVSSLLTLGLAWRVGVNEFSMHHFYRNRLMRGYLAATRRRTEREKTANAFTGFDDEDDLKLCMLKHEHAYHGPFPIINTTLNASRVTDLDRQDRKGESFIFTPLFCGFDISPTRPNNRQKNISCEYGYRPTELYAYKPKTLPNGKVRPGGPDLSTVMAISGAAANPNQGAHSSPATAFLMTVFNARLGWWIGNPHGKDWQLSDPRSGLAYLIYDLLGKTNTAQDFVCLSDGGHFDNMGLYELVRRRVRLIILGDAEQDNLFTCEGLANAVRRCRVDFGVEININVSDITTRDGKTNYSKSHWAHGTIWYPEDPQGQPTGHLIYLKSSLTGYEPVDVREYAVKNRDFPHQSTADQFFNEAQFESYRLLGLHILETALADPAVNSLVPLTPAKTSHTANHALPKKNNSEKSRTILYLLKAAFHL